MRSIIAIVVSLFALMATPARAQSSFDAAGTTCAQFLKLRAGDALHRQAANWLYGYVSGLSAGLTVGRQQAAATPADDQVLKSAAEYCQDNPGATIANAASAWVPRAPSPSQSQSEPAPEPASRPGFFIDLSKRPKNPGGRQ
jgi:hypothetical protein